MVFDVYCSILSLFEELERRELIQRGIEQFERSHIVIPDQTQKDDEDVL